jgi:hypothetical protein
MSRFRRVTGQLTDVPPHRFELPTEAFELLGVIVQGEELVDQPRHDIRPKG